MRENSMGTSKRISVNEAAEILGVTPARVYQMYREDLIRGVGRLRQDLQFSLEEVCALAELRESNESMGLGRIRAQLVQLSARMTALERSMESMERVIGLRARRVGHSKIEIASLQAKAEKALEEPALELSDIREWSEVFMGLHEEFFDLLEVHTDDPEPWRLFLELSQKMYEDCPLAGRFKNEELLATRAELDVARSNLRQAAWAYVYKRRGSAFSRQEFPDTDPDPFTHLLRTHVPR